MLTTPATSRLCTDTTTCKLCTTSTLLGRDVRIIRTKQDDLCRRVTTSILEWKGPLNYGNASKLVCVGGGGGVSEGEN